MQNTQNVPAIVLDPEEGYAGVTAGGKTVRIDLFETLAKLSDLTKRHQGGAQAEYTGALRTFVEGLGLPRVNAFQAVQFVQHVVRACQDKNRELGEHEPDGE